jgi:hypothetical protein
LSFLDLDQSPARILYFSIAAVNPRSAAVPFDHPVYLFLTVFVFLVFGIVVAYVDRIASRRPEPDGHPAE